VKRYILYCVQPPYVITRSLCLLRRSLPQMGHGVRGSVWHRRC